jgi:hypothetical protein
MVKVNAKLGDKSEHKGLTPDEWDEKNIRNLITMWNKAHPRGKYQYLQDSQDERKTYIEYLNIYDHVEYMRSVVKRDRKLTAVIDKGKKDAITLSASLPPSFASELRKAYPTLLTDKKQTAWFLRKFPEFNLSK